MMECKDPTIIYRDGTYYLYYVYQKMVEPFDDPLKQTHTGINVATSTDLVDWKDHGAVVEDRWITNPVCGPWGYETPRAVQHDGKIYLFAMYYQGLQYTVGDDPFNFGPWRVVGHWHAPVFIRDERAVVHHPLVQALRQALYAGKQRRALPGVVHRRAGMERGSPRSRGPAGRNGGLALGARGRMAEDAVAPCFHRTPIEVTKGASRISAPGDLCKIVRPEPGSPEPVEGSKGSAPRERVV